MDWKFIWVVRDPRALAASQEHAKGDEAEDTCQQMAANLNLLLNPTANWIRNKILIIRYEGMIKLYLLASVYFLTPGRRRNVKSHHRERRHE